MTGKQSSTDSSSRWTRLMAAVPTRTQALTIFFAVLMVASMPAPFAFAAGMNSGTAEAATAQQTTTTSSLNTPSITQTTTTTTTDNASYYDDFEDGDLDGWVVDPADGSMTISEESFWGDYSLSITDEYDAGPNTVSWEDGPEFDTHDNFEISGTVRPSGNDETVQVGLRSDDHDNHAMIFFSFVDGETYLGTDIDRGDDDDTLNSSFEGTWTEFRLQFDGGEARAKVWEAGTEEPSDWQLKRDYGSFTGHFGVSAGFGGDSGRELLLDNADAGGHVVSGQFVDQNGDPVPNATVEGYGVNYANIEQRLEEQAEDFNATAEELEEEAQKLLDEAEGVNPPEGWTEFYETYKDSPEAISSEQFADGLDGTYPLVHEYDDWSQGSTDVLSEEVADPRHTVDSGEQVVISLWALEDENIIIPEGPVSNSHPGGITDGTIVLEQYSAGDPVDSQTIDTEDDTFVIERPSVMPNTDVPAIKTHLSTGVYRVHPEGSPEKSYWFQVGDAEAQWNALETELENRRDELEDGADQYAERAQKLVENIDIGEMERRTVTTDENGYFEVRFQTGVQKAAVQPYRADGEILTEITGPSFDDLRDAAEDGYNGTYVLGAPQRFEAPSQDVTLEGYRADELPQHPLEDFNDFLEWKQDQILNESLEDIRSEYDQKFSEMERVTLEKTYESHKRIIDANSRAEDRYLERSDFDEVSEADDLDTDELAEETSHMQAAIVGLDKIAPPGDGAIGISDGELSAEYPLPDGIDESTISPELHWTDGSHEEIPEEYWSVESDGSIPGVGGQTLTIDGYPVDVDDPAAFDLRVMGSGNAGLFDGRISGTNPAFAGTVPDVRAIDVNTLSPGASERVSMELRTGDGEGFDALESVEVFGPDGQTLETTVDASGSASFTTNGAGEHFVRAAISSSTGDQFVRTFSLRALEEGRDNYATVRAEEAAGEDLFAVAGDGLRDAEITTDDDRVGISAIARSGDTPSRVDVKATKALHNGVETVDIRVLEGVDEATIDSKIETVIHFDSLADDTIMWRGEPSWVGSQPMSIGSAERYAEVLERDGGKTVIRTYTQDTGELSIYVNEDPTWMQSQKHTVSSYWPSISFWPFSTVWPILGIGVAGLVRRRTVAS